VSENRDQGIGLNGTVKKQIIAVFIHSKDRLSLGFTHVSKIERETVQVREKGAAWPLRSFYFYYNVYSY